MLETLERRRVFLMVFLLALGFRAALFFSKLMDVAFINGDSPQYMSLAESLVQHHVFGIDGVPKMNRTPGYPAFLALLFAPIGHHSQFLITFAQIALDSIVCCLVVDIARRMRVGRPALLATAVLAITCVYTATFTFQIMTESLYTFAITAALWLAPMDGGAASDFPGNWKRALACGACLGFGVLVRPGLLPSAVIFLGLISAQTVRQIGWRNMRLRSFAAAFAFGLGVCAFVTPWMLRNYMQFPSEYRKPSESHATLLGQWSPSPYYRHYFTPQFNAWKWSCEEPFVMTQSNEMPSVMRFVYGSEVAELGRAFADLKDEMKAGDAPISESTLNEFGQIAHKRFAAAPRLYVTAPLSRAIKLWITPRIGGLFQGHSGADAPRALTIGMTLYNFLYVAPGLLGLVLGWRRRGIWVWTLAFSLVAGHTILHSLWFPDVTSRYAIPMFPLLCIGFGITLERLATRLRRPHDPSKAGGARNPAPFAVASHEARPLSGDSPVST
jgi:hypothetical protein